MSAPEVRHVFHLQANAAEAGAVFDDWRTVSSWLTEESAVAAMSREAAEGGTYYGGIVPPLRITSEVTVRTVIAERPVHPDILTY